MGPLDFLSMFMGGAGGMGGIGRQGGDGISGGPPTGMTPPKGGGNPLQSLMGMGGGGGQGGGAQSMQMMGALMKGMSPPPKSPALVKSKGGVSGGPRSRFFRGYVSPEPTNSPGAALGQTLNDMGKVGVADQEKTANQGVNQQIMAYMMAQMAAKGGVQPTVPLSDSGAPAMGPGTNRVSYPWPPTQN